MRVIIADSMEEPVLKEISKISEVEYKPENLKQALKMADILIVRSATKVTAELLQNTSLKMIIRAGVGIDNIDCLEAERKGIKVLNTPKASTNAVSEMALGLIIATLKNIQKAHYQMKNKEWKKKELVGSEIYGKTLGIIGYGRIGESLAKKAQVLGMNVLAYNEPKKDSPGINFVSLNELFELSDVISLHIPSSPQTKNMINRDNISKMKNGVVIVNTSRGEVIDEEALYNALKSGKISAAALDVYKEEPYKGKLLELDNVYFTPHIAANTVEAQERIGIEIIEILKGAK